MHKAVETGNCGNHYCHGHKFCNVYQNCHNRIRITKPFCSNVKLYNNYKT